MGGNPLADVIRGLRNLIRLNQAYLRSSDFRRSVQPWTSAPQGVQRSTAALDPGRVGEETSKRSAMEGVNATLRAQAHRGLSESAMSLLDIVPDESVTPALNILLPELHPGRVFAGVSTALDVGNELARSLGVPVRVITLSGRIVHRHVASTERYLQERFGSGIEHVVRAGLVGLPVSENDYWLCTHWVTAHAASVASMDGVIDSSRTIYLIQDFEPGFNAWSTSFEVARDTYHRGFTPLVNSQPLAAYLSQEGIAVPTGSVFAPHLNLEALQRVSERRETNVHRLLLYGRPSKPRNMFDLAIAALRRAIAESPPGLEKFDFVSAGEYHPDIDLGRGHTLRSVGVLDWDGYLDLLAASTVVLSLQASPHPSHPPLEAAVSGARAVTNDFAGTRSGLHLNLNAVPADPESLGSALVEAIAADLVQGTGPYDGDFGGRLGAPMKDAIRNVVSLLGQK
ncbi:hypothetical protein EV140_2274 [Microcella alkaliphila]|uniref:Uncharacterized protein n=2 Tax=Microcella alkaliphila TaxID=279828 RepID=A0A4Q7TDQ8_9MICO|nr:hypothetical protein EV140_2274 [Microcella alkaliphila]